MTYNHDDRSLSVPPSAQDHIQGALNAAVVFVMYGDYECFQSANVYRLEGLKLMRQLFQSNAFDEFRVKEIAPGFHIQSDAALVAYIRDTCSTVWHPVGTCKMGTDAMAVVNSELRVHGVEGLRVVDASIMPTIITGNTNAPTIMIGEKAADLIKAERTSQSIPNKLNVHNLIHSSI